MLLLAACTPTVPAGVGPRDLPPRDVETRPADWPAPHCDRLPSPRPPGAVVELSIRDGESLERTLDVAFVHDAPCPAHAILESPQCVTLDAAAMDVLWSALVERALHEIHMETHGECIHCGGPWIAIAWTGGSCDVGTSVWDDVARADWDRFDAAVGFLERVAGLAGIERRER